MFKMFSSNSSRVAAIIASLALITAITLSASAIPTQAAELSVIDSIKAFFGFVVEEPPQSPAASQAVGLSIVNGVPMAAMMVSGDTVYDSFADGDFTANPVWGGNTTLWTIVANSDAAAGATGSNTLRLNAAATTSTDYLSSQIGTWGDSQEWGVFFGRRAQAFTAANQQYFWLYANESTLNNATVDGYRLAIGDDTGNDEIRLEYVVNGAVSATVITSSGAVTNAITDVGFLVRVTRSSSGGWEMFTSALPTTTGTGAIATDVPNSTNAALSQGTGTNNSLPPAANGYLGVAALHSTGATAIVTAEFDQVFFTATSAGATPPT